MQELIQKIIENNNAIDAANKIVKLIQKHNVTNSFTVDDLRKAFLAGRESVEATVEYFPFTDGETYASQKVVKSFRQYMHENYK